MKTSICAIRINRYLILFFLLFLAPALYGQINYTQDFNGCNAANCGGWTIASGWQPSITATTGDGYTPCTNSSAKSNIYGSSTTTTLTSNASLGTSTGNLATFSFNYKCVDYSTGAATAANSCTFTVAWSPDGTTWNTIGSFQNISTSTCIASPVFTFTPPVGLAIRMRITANRSAGDFWAVMDDITLTQPITPTPTLLNLSADPTLSTSFAHRRGASINPKFTISSSSSFNAVQIEMNQLANFSGPALVSTINDGTNYNAATPYDFWTTEDLTGDRTYFVRARVSNNGGSTWGSWTTQLWPYSYYPATPYEKEGWYFTAQEQFQLGTVNETNYNFISIQNNSTAYPDDDFFRLEQGSFDLTVSTNGDQYLTEASNNYSGASSNYITVGSYYLSGSPRQDYHGFRFTDFPVPNGANILSSNLRVYSHHTGGEPGPNNSNPLYLELVGVNQANANAWADNTNTATGGPRWRVRRSITTPWNITASWTDLALMTSPDISSIIEDIVGIPGYVDGNAIAVIVDYTGGAHSSLNRHRYFTTGRRNVIYRPSIFGTFTNFYNTVRFPNVNRVIYGPDATAWDELRVTDNTVGCGTCYVEYRIHDAGTNAVLAGPFLRPSGMSGAQYFDISGVAASTIYVTTRVYRNNSPTVDDIWLTVSDISPLPVEWSAIQAECTTNGVELRWSTASEQNNDYFTVEKTTDGLSWNEVCQVSGSGNSNTTQSYSCLDNNQREDLSYYRVRQTDYDGNSKFSQIITVRCTEANEFAVIPNPNSGEFTLTGGKSGMTATIFDPVGRKINEVKLTSHFTHFNLEGSSQGVYLIQIREEHNTTTLRIVIQ